MSRQDFTFDADRHVYVCPVDFLMDDITGYNDAQSNSGMRRPQRLVRFTLTSRHLRARCAVLSTLNGAFGGDRGMAIRAAAAARLLKAFATEVEALRRYGGSQFVRVEHVHVNDGGHAIVGYVSNAQGSA